VAAVGGWRVLTTSEVTLRQRFDVPGVILATGGLVALVFACSQAVPEGWGSPTVVALLLTSALLLCPFAVRETRAPSPLLPLRVLLNRNRGGAYVSVMLVIAGMFGAFLFLTYYLQVVLRYSPVEAGLGFLPIAAASRFGSWAIASLLMPHVPPRALIAPGALMAAAGMLVLTQLQITGSYLTHVLPAEILVGIGIACVMVPAFSTATLGVDQREAGAAAATVNTASQVGGSLGTALLNTIAASAIASYLASQPLSAHVHALALVHGYSIATAAGAAILALGAVLALVLINAGKPPRRRTNEARADDDALARGVAGLGVRRPVASSTGS
jgi:predicted MFS family arabinose efflux permease